MKKYYIGLIILAVLTLGFTIFTLMQGAVGKQDKETERKGGEIAKQLNKYISSKQKIPESLGEAGINDVPPTIRYTKKSAERYEFCVTFKTASRGYAVNGVEEVLYQSLAPAPTADQELFGSEYESAYEPSTLYLPYGHKKGENCQTIKPYFRSPSSFQYNSSLDQYCEPTHRYYETYKKYCVNGKLDFSAPSTGEPVLTD